MLTSFDDRIGTSHMLTRKGLAFTTAWHEDFAQFVTAKCVLAFAEIIVVSIYGCAKAMLGCSDIREALEHRGNDLRSGPSDNRFLQQPLEGYCYGKRSHTSWSSSCHVYEHSMLLVERLVTSSVAPI